VEPDDGTPGLDEVPRMRYRRWLKVAANVMLGAAISASAIAVIEPNGYAPTIAFASFVVYLLIGWVRSQT
jgi:hypothetical protein